MSASYFDDNSDSCATTELDSESENEKAYFTLKTTSILRKKGKAAKGKSLKRVTFNHNVRVVGVKIYKYRGPNGDELPKRELPPMLLMWTRLE